MCDYIRKLFLCLKFDLLMRTPGLNLANVLVGCLETPALDFVICLSLGFYNIRLILRISHLSLGLESRPHYVVYIV